MDVFSGNKLTTRFRRPVVTVGVFDGIHRGHQRVIHDLVRRARQARAMSLVITFDPHPVHVLYPKSFCPLIVSVPHRLRLMASMGVKACWVIRFTRRFAKIRPDDFIQYYLAGVLRPQTVIIGDDFYFGHNRRGTVRALRQQGRQSGFEVLVVPTRVRGTSKISSSRIRRDIAAGDLDHAARLLGRPFSVWGRVVRGDGRGRRLGYPTANIHPSGHILPPSGVYIVQVQIGRRTFKGVANVGRRPSFKTIAAVNLEVHLFAFKKNLYGNNILVRFYRKIRDEKIFRSQDELARRIHRDEKEAKQWFARHRLPPPER